jgi:hypothetical protein
MKVLARLGASFTTDTRVGATMHKKTEFRTLLKGSLAAAALLFAGAASAHQPYISAVAVCDDNNDLVIEYTATAWAGPTALKRTNPDIAILVNSVEVDSGAFGSPDFSFSGTVAAPAGTSAVVTARADGTWGDGFPGGQSDSVTVEYPAEPCAAPTLGRFTGGGKQIRVSDGLKITRGLTIHCDLLLSNNLQVNWSTSNHFHMREYLRTVSCTDDPAIHQQPPPAPIDTLVGVGRGRFNGVSGYTIEFTLVDAGEPGGNDQMAIKIYQTSNPSNVVLEVPLQQLTGGNLQAHYDQPHKQ